MRLLNIGCQFIPDLSDGEVSEVDLDISVDAACDVCFGLEGLRPHGK